MNQHILLPCDDVLIIINLKNLSTLSFAREAWKDINLGEGFTNAMRIEVSDFGRIRSYNQINKGKLLKGSKINGYSIIRIKLFRPRDTETNEKFRSLQSGLAEHIKKVKALEKLVANKENTPSVQRSLNVQLEDAKLLLKKNKAVYDSFLKKDVNKRTFHYAGLIHRLVAEHFLPAPTPEQTIVTHLDHDKTNNLVTNLKWITEEEKSAHQLSSPLVIAEKEKRKHSIFNHPGRSKLSITKVMFLKKLLNEGKPISNLAKQFKITETQVAKIKKEESWGSVEAAK